MNRYLIFVLLLIMFTFSCAGENIAVRQEKHRAALQSWMDHDVNDLIRSWGYPQQVNDMPNGNKLITYQRITQRTNPVMMLPQTTTYDVYGNTIYKNQGPGMMIGGDTETFYCTINFEINQQGRIIFFKSEGNNCY